MPPTNRFPPNRTRARAGETQSKNKQSLKNKQIMSLLFLAFLVMFYFLVRGQERPALILLSLMLLAILAILKWEATTPLNLVF